jgi:hypothetical protein
MIQYIHDTFERAALPYAIAFGTALGYVRTGAFLPWDEDVDIVIPIKMLQRAQSVISPPYCTVLFWGGFKIFKCDSPHAGKYPWRYPFVDVFHSGMGAASIKSASLSAKSIINSIMFPSIKAQFANTTVYIPKHLSTHLRSRYGNIEKCVEPHWNHSHEYPLKKAATVPSKCVDVFKECTTQLTSYWPLLLI